MKVNSTFWAFLFLCPFKLYLELLSCTNSLEALRSKDCSPGTTCPNAIGFPIRTILASLDPHFIPIFPVKFPVNLPLGSESEGQNRLSRWRLWQQSYISDFNKFSYFLSTGHQDTPYKVSIQLDFRFRRRSSK